METKTEAPELTRELIDKAAHVDPWTTIGALQAVALAEPGHEASMRDSAARTLTRYVERHGA
ncbi:hypothetical protein [Nocardioides sp. YR527]|uniref:hypothetical protein n=1 Tax=Nocardioides sp. YR527 TaxID=1881028 RepID=UPI000B8839CF|nr:hypothetical protein [Nocardioides sp. YR527]